MLLVKFDIQSESVKEVLLVRFAIQSKNVKEVRFYFTYISSHPWRYPWNGWGEVIKNKLQLVPTFLPVAPGFQVEVIPKVPSEPYELTLKIFEYAGEYDSAIVQQIPYLSPPDP